MNDGPNFDEQMILPFAEREYVDVARTARIFGVTRSSVYRMAGYGDRQPTIKLISYLPGSRKRVLYSSIVAFCDYLRAEFAIADRRPQLAHPMFRHCDDDLLPFPLKDTIYSAEAMAALGYDDSRPLLRLVEEGCFEAYRLRPMWAWRISRISFKRFLAETRDREFTTLRSLTSAALR